MFYFPQMFSLHFPLLCRNTRVDCVYEERFRDYWTDISVCPTNKRFNPCNSGGKALTLLEINQSHSCSHTKPGIAVVFGLSAACCGCTPTPEVSHETHSGCCERCLGLVLLKIPLMEYHLYLQKVIRIMIQHMYLRQGGQLRAKGIFAALISMFRILECKIFSGLLSKGHFH